MGTVLAALDDSAAAAPVTATASALAELFGAGIEALTVRTNGAGTEAAAAAAAAGVPLREIRGVPVERLVNIGNRPDVVALVLGARGSRFGKRPLGSTATAVATSVPKPVVVVPPDAPAHDRVRRVLFPLEGTLSTSLAPRAVVQLAARASVEVVALHVHADGVGSLPQTAAWTQSFLARYAPWGVAGIQLEVRAGRAADIVPAVAEEVGADLVALAWARVLEPRRAPVVQAALARPIPVILIPVEVAPGDDGYAATETRMEGGER